MKISIVIPAHNEKDIIRRTIKKVSDVLKKKNYNFEIVIVDDNSDDGTSQILDRLKNRRIRVIHKKNKVGGPSGLGAALIPGLNRASGDFIIPFMGDLSDNPKDIPKIVEALKEFDIICASRFLEQSKLVGYPPIKFLCTLAYNKIFSLLFGLGVSDFTNAFKGYRKEVIRRVKPVSRGFEITSEIVLKGRLLGYSIGEVPVDWRGRAEGEGETKFAAFSVSDIFSGKLLKIGYSYGRIALSLYPKLILNQLTRGYNQFRK